MTSLTQIAFRCGFRTLAFLACVAVFAPQPTSARGGAEDACVRWPQRRLMIGGDLQSRRFVLEPRGELEAMPGFRVAEGRSIYHRPFSLLLDVGGRVAVYFGDGPRRCVLSRDSERSSPMKIPVFFVGRPGGSLDELRENAEALAFDPSAGLDAGSDFSDVTFRLRRGGSRFDAIRPFFLCGLTGLLVCQESCPQDWDILAASLVNQIVRGVPDASPSSRRQEANAPSATEEPAARRRLSPSPAPPSSKSQPGPRVSQAPSNPPQELESAPMPPARGLPENAAPAVKPETCASCPPPAQRPETTALPEKPQAAKPPAPQAQPPATTALPPKEVAPPSPAPAQPPAATALPPKEAAPPSPAPAQPPATTPSPPKEAAPPSTPQAQPPETATAPPKVEAAPAPPPVPALPPPSAPQAQPAPSPPKPAQAEPAPQPKAPEAAPPPATPPPPPQHIVLAFERKNGEALQAADVMQAEGALKVEGVPLQAASEGLTADLPAEAAKKAGDAAYLKKLLRRYQLLGVRKEPERLVLVVEPLYVRAEDLKIEISDAAGEAVRGCELALDVSADRRLGDGWGKLGEKERLHGLEFSETGSHYALNLPIDIDPNELLISTADPGNAARLANIGSGCQLEGRPWVTVEELRTGKIARSLQRTGQTLIAVFSTDSSFASSIGAAAVDGFWSDALRLVNVVSTAAWEKKVLGRAQAPGVSPETGKLQAEGQGGALAGDGGRGTSLKILGKGSQEPAGPASIFQVKPIDRHHLDLALKLIREDASIPARYSVKQEALILITGSVRESGSYFCQYSVRRDKSPWSSPQWVKQARRIFDLEVWSAAAVEDMQKSSRIKPGANAPEGVYMCNIQGPESDKIVLYGIVPKVITDANARAKAFSYLTTQANSFLKP